MDTPNSNNYVELDGNGHLTIDVGEHDDFSSDGPAEPGRGVNSNSRTWFDGMFQICNQGKEDACVSYTAPDDFGRDDAELIFYYDGDTDGDPTTSGRVDIAEGESLPIPLGECVTIGLRTETFGVDATDEAPLFDGEATIVADVDGNCFDAQPTPDPACPDCTTPDPGTNDFDVTIESVDDSAFPTVATTVRVDTTAGGNGDLINNFKLCEETVGGLGDGYCGQDIENVTFGGEQEETLADVMFVLDTSGSMGFEQGKFRSAKDGAITLIGGDADTTNDANAGGFDPTVNVGLVTFASDSTLVSPLGTDQNQVESDIDSLSSGGGTSLGAGISEANDEFDTSPENRDNAPDFMIVLGNGDTSGGVTPANTAKTNGTTIFGIAYGSGASVNDFENIVGEEPSDPDWEDFVFDADQDNITDIFDEIGSEIFGTYTIEYETANFATDGNDRNVRVYVDDPSAGDADATDSYTAPSS